MTTNITQQTYLETLTSLPQPVQEVIAGTQWQGTLRNIGERYRLHIDKLGTLENLMKYLMTGLLTVDEFFDEVSEFELDPGVLEPLLNDIETHVLSVLKNQLLEKMESVEAGEISETQEIQETQEADMTTPPPAQSASARDVSYTRDPYREIIE